MLFRLFFCLTVVPFVELMILLRLSARWGWGPTLGLVIVTGVVGAVLARRAGVKVIARINQELERGEMPTSSMVDGVLILIAGVVLITPGVLTDLCGFALLTAPVRAWLRKKLIVAWADRIVVQGGPFGDRSDADDTFVDVEGSSVPADPGGTDGASDRAGRLMIEPESRDGA